MTRITEMTGTITLRRLGMSVAYVESISHRGIARKLKQEQKNERKERGKTNPTSWFICKLTAADDRDDLAD